MFSENVTLLMFEVVCPCVFLAGLIDAIAGGGGMISLPGYLISGVSSHYAIGTNKLSSAIGTVVSTFRYCKNGYVDWILAIPTVILSVIGSVMGAKLALLVSGNFLTYFLLVTLPLLAILILKNKKFERRKPVKLDRTGIIIVGSAISLVIGAYDGFYGPGTGTFLTLAFTLGLGMDVKKAAGNVKLCNLSSNIAALITFLINGKVYVLLGLVAAIFSILGHYLGSSVVMKKGGKAVRPIMIIVIVIMYVKIIYDNFIQR